MGAERSQLLRSGGRPLTGASAQLPAEGGGDLSRRAEEVHTGRGRYSALEHSADPVTPFSQSAWNRMLCTLWLSHLHFAHFFTLHTARTLHINRPAWVVNSDFSHVTLPLEIPHHFIISAVMPLLTPFSLLRLSFPRLLKSHHCVQRRQGGKIVISMLIHAPVVLP